MLNPIPTQFLALFAYFILRICVGLCLFYLGASHYRHRRELTAAVRLPLLPRGRITVWWLIFLELVLSVMLVLGFYTQIAAIILMALSAEFFIFRRWSRTRRLPPRLFYALLFGAAFSLFITGAGVFAFDLPL